MRRQRMEDGGEVDVNLGRGEGDSRVGVTVNHQVHSLIKQRGDLLPGFRGGRRE